MQEPVTFYALAYRYENDAFYNFSTEDLSNELNFSCLLPSENVAKMYIEENLGTFEFEVFPVKLLSYNRYKDGVHEFEYNTPSCWRCEDEEDAI